MKKTHERLESLSLPLVDYYYDYHFFVVTNLINFNRQPISH